MAEERVTLQALHDVTTEFQERLSYLISLQFMGMYPTTLAQAERAAQEVRDRVRQMIDDVPIGATESFEMAAADFYSATGMMAPGKDAPAAWGSVHTREERQAAWDAWCAARR